jgi:ABC-type Fe3+-hydroxamate transport system substrate-binding protein
MECGAPTAGVPREATEPDLVLTFSDLQADIAADLIRHRLDIHAFNQRSVAGIVDMIRMIGAIVDASERAQQLVDALPSAFSQSPKLRGPIAEAAKGSRSNRSVWKNIPVLGETEGSNPSPSSGESAANEAQVQACAARSPLRIHSR